MYGKTLALADMNIAHSVPLLALKSDFAMGWAKNLVNIVSAGAKGHCSLDSS